MLSFSFIPFINKKLTAIDIGHYTLKIVQIKKKKDKIKLNKFFKKKLPLEAVKEGKVVNISAVTSLLKTVLKENNLKIRKAVTTIGSDQVIIRNINMPVMAEKELKEALKWEAEDYLPFSVEEAVIDYIIIDEKENKYDLIMVAVLQNVAASYISTLKNASIKPISVNAQPLALLSLLNYQFNLKAPVAVVDIGENNTRVIIGNKKTVNLSRSIDIGGGDFTEKLIETGLDYEEAENKKREIDISNLKNINKFSLETTISQLENNNQINKYEIFSPLIEELISELSRSIEYFHNQHRGANVENIFITGGASKLTGLKQIIQNELDQELKEINPLKGLENVEELSETDSSYHTFAVPLGLAISEVYT